VELAKGLLKKDRAAALARQRAEAALAAAKAGRPLADLFPTEEAARKARRAPARLGAAVVAADTTGLFGADGAFVPKLGAVEGLAATAMATPVGKALPTVVETAQGPAVAVVVSREKPDEAQYGAQKDAIATRLRNRRESQVQQAWLKRLREGAQVEINKDLAGQTAAANAG
jgi:peptidyl-prolyl cis-trans isomerase D